MAIKEKRIAAKMTQQELAQKMGVTQGAIAQWENGITFPSAKRMKALAKILKCKIEELL